MRRGKPAKQLERILILGYEKSGKSRLATSLPWGPYFGSRAVYVAADSGSEHLRSILTHNAPHLEVIKPEPKSPHWSQDYTDIAVHDWASEGFTTLIWDDMTEVSKILLKVYSESGVFSKNQAVKLGIPGTPGYHTSSQEGDYGAVQNTIGHLMMKLTDQPLHLVVLTKKKFIEPDAKHPDGLRGGPDIVGKQATQWLGGYFDSTFHCETTIDPKTRRGVAMVHTATKGIWPAGYRCNRPEPKLAATVALESDPVHFWLDYLADVLDDPTVPLASSP